MSATSSIEWTDRTWNPVRGCSVISPGCVNCYAMKQAHRFSGPGKSYEGLTKLTSAGPQWTGVVRTVEGALLEPLSWRKPQRIFVNSMSDLFHESVPDEFIDRVFAAMALAPQHTFQVLTKRPERMREFMQDRVTNVADAVRAMPVKCAESFAISLVTGLRLSEDEEPRRMWPLRNVWLGVSCEDPQRADERIPLLLQTSAAVRFISAEPLIRLTALRRWLSAQCAHPGEFCEDVGCTGEPAQVHWVIVGGESGPGARPCDLGWIRSIVQECKAAHVPVFVKQRGSSWYDSERREGIRGSCVVPVDAPWRWVTQGNRKGGDIDEWPEDLRIRQFPQERTSV